MNNADLITKECPVCGRKFHTIPVGGRRFCSRVCYEAWQAKRRKCVYCGKEFTPYGDERFCSDDCFREWRYTRVHRTVPDLSLPPE